MQSVTLKNISKDYRINEAYKTLRTNLEFSGSDKRAIVLTSSTPNEGKSTVSQGLAMSLAEGGKRVLLIDADLRKSVLRGRHRVTSEVKGLSHYLSGQARVADVVFDTGRGDVHHLRRRSPAQSFRTAGTGAVRRAGSRTRRKNTTM